MFKLEREGIGVLAGHSPAYDLSCKVIECRREIQVMRYALVCDLLFCEPLDRAIQHPNILHLVGVVIHPLSLVTSLLDGGSLYNYIHNPEAPLPWPLKVNLLFFATL